jgi:hypothetical protein
MYVSGVYVSGVYVYMYVCVFKFWKKTKNLLKNKSK